MWANAVKGEALQRLTSSGTTENLIRELRNFGLDASSRSAFHKNLILREMKQLGAIQAQLDDATIANALNHVIVTLGDGAPDGFAPYSPDDIAAHRGDGLTPAAVHEIRAGLALD